MKTSDREDRERLLRLEDLILELQELSDSGTIIVVEGRKDMESLRFLGIKGEIRLASQQPLLEFTDLLSKSKKEIILLTDWDTKGGFNGAKNYTASFTLWYFAKYRYQVKTQVAFEKKDKRH